MHLTWQLFAALASLTSQAFGQADTTDPFFLRDTLYGQYALMPMTAGAPVQFVEPAISINTGIFHITNRYLKIANDDSGYAVDSENQLNPFSFGAMAVSGLAMAAGCAVNGTMLECEAGGRTDWYICENPSNHLYIGHGEDVAEQFARLSCHPTVLEVVPA